MCKQVPAGKFYSRRRDFGLIIIVLLMFFTLFVSGVNLERIASQGLSRNGSS